MELVFAVMLFVLATLITPGPNNIMVMTSGLNHGIKKTLPHYLGICTGFPVMVVAVGFGLGAVFKQAPIIHIVIKVLGIGYLLYLAWLIATTETVGNGKKTGKPLTFIQAALFQWVNPKAWVMAVGAIAAYTTVSGNVNLQVMIISATFFVFALPCVGLWLMFGAGLQKIIKNPKHQRRFNIAMALLLVASILPLIFSQLGTGTV